MHNIIQFTNNQDEKNSSIDVHCEPAKGLVQGIMKSRSTTLPDHPREIRSINTHYHATRDDLWLTISFYWRPKSKIRPDGLFEISLNVFENAQNSNAIKTKKLDRKSQVDMTINLKLAIWRELLLPLGSKWLRT